MYKTKIGGTVKSENCILMNWEDFRLNSMSRVIRFTEFEDFPRTGGKNEKVLNVIGNGWRRSNTRLFVVSQYSFKDLTCDLTEEADEPEIGKSFSVEIKKESFYYSCYCEGIKVFFFVVVFVKGNGEKL